MRTYNSARIETGFQDVSQASQDVPLIKARLNLSQALASTNTSDEVIGVAMAQYVNAFHDQKPEAIWGPDANVKTISTCIHTELSELASIHAAKTGDERFKHRNNVTAIGEEVWPHLHKEYDEHVVEVGRQGFTPHVGAATIGMLRAIAKFTK